jgi:hypothetical protein
MLEKVTHYVRQLPHLARATCFSVAVCRSVVSRVSAAADRYRQPYASLRNVLSADKAKYNLTFVHTIDVILSKVLKIFISQLSVLLLMQASEIFTCYGHSGLNAVNIHSFIHSFSSLSHDRSKASSKANSLHSAI